MRWLWRGLICIWAYMCVCTIGKICSLNGDALVYWGGEYFSYNITSVFFFGVSIWLTNRFLLQKNVRLKVISLIGGLCLSLAIVYGAYAHYVNDIFLSTRETFLQFGMVASLLALTMPIVAELLLFLEKAEVWFQEKQTGCKLPAWAFFLLMWASIFLCYVPLFLAWWPGNFVFDSKYQLQNVIEGWYFTHHPLIHTLMMGKAYELGQSMGNVSRGVQFYTLAQMLILASAFAYTMLYLYKKQVRKSILVGAWVFFAIFPMNALFSISATKDVLCAAFFLYFMVFLVRYVVDQERFGPVSYVGMVVTGALLALFRNNALYAVLITGVVLILFQKGWKEKGKLVLLFAGIYVLATLTNNSLISYTNAKDTDSYRETFCIPLQCLGRVANYRKDELDVALYEEIIQYIREEDIGGYNPYIADAVKNNANEELLRSNTLNFFKLWVKVGLQFPGEYVESIVTNTLGYWYPLNQGYYVSAEVALYHTLIGMGDEIVKVNRCNWAYEIYSPLFWAGEYRNVPILTYFFRNSPYVWLVILGMLWSIQKKDRARILVGMLPLLYLLTCMCGPMAALRYIYCNIVCMPLWWYLMLSTKGKDEKSMESVKETKVGEAE